MKRVLLILAGLAALGFAAPVNRHQARSDARRILGELRLPPGAAASASDPSGGVLRQPASRPATPNLVDVHGFWTLPGDPQGALDWIERHPPAGSRQTLSGAGAGSGAQDDWFAGFSFPGPAERTLLVTVTDAGGGTTALRADAQVIWLAVRPRWERVPSAVRLVTVTQGPTAMVEGDPGRVRRIAGLVNHLPVAQPGATACPVDTGQRMRLAFRRSANGPPVAVAIAEGGGCGLVTFSLHGRRGPVLAGGRRLIRRVRAILR